MLLTSLVIRSRVWSSAIVLPVVESDDRPVTLPLSLALRGELDIACPFPLLLIVLLLNVDVVVLVPTIVMTCIQTILQFNCVLRMTMLLLIFSMLMLLMMIVVVFTTRFMKNK